MGIVRRNRFGSRGPAAAVLRILALLVTTALTLSMLAAPAPAAAATQTITYEVRGKGNSTSLEVFNKFAAETFADTRGWGLGGSIRFVRVPSGGQFTLWLSAAKYLPGFSSGCSTNYSCRVGRNVIINETNFLHATPAWRATGASLRNYQHMVVNHELGHFLGFGHAYCSGSGRLAPVMQQQSKGMQGCRPNAWPTASERSILSQRRGVPIITAPPTPPKSPRVPGGNIVRVPAAGAPGTGIPANAEAVAATITVTDPVAPGFVTAFPCAGSVVPPTSNLNVARGGTAAAYTLVAPGNGGAICVRPSTTAHVVVDISGYVPAGSSYTPVAPQRLLDSRQGGGPLTAPVSVQLPVGAASAGLTVTVTEPATSGHVTVYPCGADMPLASTLNYAPGQTVANFALAKAGSQGQVCLRSSSAAHMVVDLVGTFPDGGGYAATSPRRLIDTRSGPVPTGVTAVTLPRPGPRALNLTVTGPRGSGWARAFPCGQAQPSTSNINFGVRQTVANALVAAPGADGRLCIATSAPTHLVLDDSGSVGDVRNVKAVRLLDTRKR